MQFKIKNSDFLHYLNVAALATPRRTTLPLLEHTLIEAGKDRLLLYSTDQDITFRGFIPAFKVQIAEAGCGLLHLGKLKNIIQTLPPDAESSISIADYSAEIKCGRTKMSLPSLDPEEYWDLSKRFDSEQWSNPEFSSFSLDAAQILDISRSLLYAVSKDEYRPSMLGVAFTQTSEHLTCVATDSFRLNTLELFETFYDGPEIIVLPRMIDILAKLQSDFSLLYNSKRKVFCAGNPNSDMSEFCFEARIIDEKYPPFRSLVPDPETISTKFTANRAEFANALKIAMLGMNESSKQINITLKDNVLSFSGEDEDTKMFSETDIEAAVERGETELKIGFNAWYLSECINSLKSESVSIFVGDQTRPIFFQSDEKHFNLIMPMKNQK